MSTVSCNPQSTIGSLGWQNHEDILVPLPLLPPDPLSLGPSKSSSRASRSMERLLLPVVQSLLAGRSYEATVKLKSNVAPEYVPLTRIQYVWFFSYPKHLMTKTRVHDKRHIPRARCLGYGTSWCCTIARCVHPNDNIRIIHGWHARLLSHQ